MRINDVAWKSFRLDKTKNRGPALTIGIKRVYAGCLVTFAACSPKDMFSKKIARNIIKGRLAQLPEGQIEYGIARHLPVSVIASYYAVGPYLWLLPMDLVPEHEYRGKLFEMARTFLKEFIYSRESFFPLKHHLLWHHHHHIKWLKELFLSMPVINQMSEEKHGVVQKQTQTTL